VTLPDPVRLEASVRSRIERLADERAGGDRTAREAWIVRLRRDLAYRRFLARLVAVKPDAWYLKGGLALQLRLDPSRSTLGRSRQATDDHAVTIPVEAYIGAARFAQFRVDLAPPREHIPTESASLACTPLGIPELDEHGPIAVLPLTQQIAEKTCAIFERFAGVHSSRARDLADIASIALQIDGIDGSSVSGPSAPHGLRARTAHVRTVHRPAARRER